MAHLELRVIPGKTVHFGPAGCVYLQPARTRVSCVCRRSGPADVASLYHPRAAMSGDGAGYGIMALGYREWQRIAEDAPLSVNITD